MTTVRLLSNCVIPILLCQCMPGAAVQVSDTLYKFDGEPWIGYIEISCDVSEPDSDSALRPIRLGVTAGTISTALEAGSRCLVTSYPTSGAPFTTTWLIPRAGGPFTARQLINRTAAQTELLPSERTIWTATNLDARPRALGLAAQGYTWRGVWSSATTYTAYDCVSFNGAAYVAIASNTGASPESDTTTWNLMVQQGSVGPVGATGAPGTQGPQGIAGIITAAPPLIYLAGSQMLGMQRADATHDGFLLQSDWNTFNTRLSPPAGSDTQIQLNNNGNVGAFLGFGYVNSTHELTLGPPNSESAIRFPSLDASRWSVRATSSILNGVRDNLFRIGLNEDCADLSEPQWVIQMESHFYDITPPASESVEMHYGAFSTCGSLGLPPRRAIQANVFRKNSADSGHLTGDVQLLFTGNVLFHSSDNSVSQFEIVDKNPILVHSQYLAADSAGLQWLKQKRTGGTYANLAYLSVANRWLVAPDGDPLVVGSNFTVGSPVNTGDYVFKVDQSTRNVRIGNGSNTDGGLDIFGGGEPGQRMRIGDGSNYYTIQRAATTDGFMHFGGNQPGYIGYVFDGPVNAVSFTGSGTGLTSLLASQLVGSIPDGALSGNLAFLNRSNIFTGGGITINSNAVNEKLILDHSIVASGYGSQIAFRGGGLDQFVLGTSNIRGTNYFGLQDDKGLYAWFTTASRNVVVGYNNTDSGQTFQVQGNISLSTTGAKLVIKGGPNASAGIGRLTSGRATIDTSAVTPASIVLLTNQQCSNDQGSLSIGPIIAGAGFTVVSASTTSSCQFGWQIVDLN